MNDRIILIAAAGALLLVLLLVIVLFSAQNARMRRDRERMLHMLRRESEIQGEGVERLSHALSDSMRQVAELSGTLDARMDALRDRLDLD